MKRPAMKNLVKPKKIGKLILVLVFLGGLGYLSYYLYEKYAVKPKAPAVQSMNADPTITPSKTPDGKPANTPGASTIAPAGISMTPTIIPSTVSTPMAQ